tara:strand:+ start:8076 stop:8600 length:525 start_codon:yes stop_codon:yes gene_type:complete
VKLILFDSKLKSERKRYLVQVGLASVSLFIVLVASNFVSSALESKAVIVAAIASTTFVLFIMPHSDTAHPRHVAGGHLVALAIGVLFVLFADSFLNIQILEASRFAFPAFAAAGVGLSMLIMAATDTEHPPAAGTALGILSNPVSLELTLFILVSVVLLLSIQMKLRKYLFNLY